MLITVNSWWWEHKFLHKTNQKSFTRNSQRMDAMLCYLAYFRLPHIRCSLSSLLMLVAKSQGLP